MTTVDRMIAAVHRHNILWGDLAKRVAANETLSLDDASEQVCRLIEERGCTLPVAIAIIDMIVDLKKEQTQ